MQTQPLSPGSSQPISCSTTDLSADKSRINQSVQEQKMRQVEVASSDVVASEKDLIDKNAGHRVDAKFRANTADYWEDRDKKGKMMLAEEENGKGYAPGNDRALKSTLP